VTDPLLALAPIVVVLSLMLGLRWSAARAGAIGLGLALLLGWSRFDIGTEGRPAEVVAGAMAEAAFITATIMWIIIPALAIHQSQLRTGAVDRLREALMGLAGDPRITALLVAWFFALLIEGAAGFGTAAALAAPFLVSLGMRPVTAVTAALVGHTVGVSFGAVGTPILPQVAATGLDGIVLSGSVGTYHAILGWVVPVAVALLVGRALPRPDGTAGARLWAWTVVAAAAFLVPFVLIATFVGPELPTLGAAVIGGGVFVSMLLAVQGRAAGAVGEVVAAGHDARVPRGVGREQSRDGPSPRQVARAAAPYLALVALVLATRLVPPLRDALRGLELRWDLFGGEFGGVFLPLYHPGTMLLLALLAGAAWQGRAARTAGTALADTVRTMGPVVLALLAMLGLARVLVHAGMVDVIAIAAADALGGTWPLLAPAVGVLGTFVTGSATASNALFSDLQAATAAAAGLDPVRVLGAQGWGAAIGNAMAPHNVIAAAAVVGLAGHEAEILRRTVPLVIPYTLAAGAVALILTGAA
jgi:lactate permease